MKATILNDLMVILTQHTPGYNYSSDQIFHLSKTRPCRKHNCLAINKYKMTMKNTEISKRMITKSETLMDAVGALVAGVIKLTLTTVS